MSASPAWQLERLLDEVLADPLSAARRSAAEGRPVVGYVGADVPVELILAAGALPVGLGSLPLQRGAAADAYLESSFAPGVAGVAEQWLCGDLDFLEALVLPRSDDSAQRLYYYLCELQRRGPTAGRPRPLLYDLAKIPRPASRAHTRRQTAELAKLLNADPARFGQAVMACNRRRTLLAGLQARRDGEQPPAGALVQRILRGFDVCHDEGLEAAVGHWLAARPAALGGVRVLLAGSTPPDERLHRAVESAGGCVVAEHGDHSVTRWGPPVLLGETAAPLDALADHYHRLDVGARAFSDRGRRLAGEIERCRPDAAIVWLVEEDEAAVWDLPVLRRTLEAARVPVMVLTRRRWDASDGAPDEMAGFVAGLVS